MGSLKAQTRSRRRDRPALGAIQLNYPRTARPVSKDRSAKTTACSATFPGSTRPAFRTVEEHMKRRFRFPGAPFQSDLTRVVCSRRAATRRPHLPGHRHEPRDSILRHTMAAGEANILDFNSQSLPHPRCLPFIFLYQLPEYATAIRPLLSNSIIVYGSHVHPIFTNHRRCPLIVLGHGLGPARWQRTSSAPRHTDGRRPWLTSMHSSAGMTLKSFGAQHRSILASAAEDRSMRITSRKGPAVRPSRQSVGGVALLSAATSVAGAHCTDRRRRLRATVASVRKLIDHHVDVNVCTWHGMTLVDWSRAR